MNSVSPKCPFWSLSARFHMRPSTSTGNLARSKICFAVSPMRVESAFQCLSIRAEIVIPDSIPFCAPDSSKRDEYCATLSGVNGGTLIGPLFWACRGCACVCGCSGPAGVVKPSNLGSGPPAMRHAVNFFSSSPFCRIHLHFNASSAETGCPACAYPINRRTMPNPAGVSSPRFSLSAICQICVVFACVSTSLELACPSVYPPLLKHPVIDVSFRRTSLPPLQSLHQSFRYPQRKTTGRRVVAPRGSGGGRDALELKGSQLQSIWQKVLDLEA